MPRPHASVPPDAIRIEDEVWQEAFTRREAARPRSQPRLQAIEGGRSTPAVTASPHPVPETSQVMAPRTAAAQRQPARTAGGVPGRRTVVIRGYGAERNLPWPDGSSRRPQRRAYERAGFRPDRVALWAVMLCILLVIVAVASPHG